MTYRIVAEYRTKKWKSAEAKYELLSRIEGLEFLSICRRDLHDDSWKEAIRNEKSEVQKGF